MLHYRNTGDFARNLVENAVTDQQKAFAFGYLSHIATDVTGHPYVNQISGTTYRLNVQRHVMTENYQDTWKYAQYYNGESINHTLFDQLGLPEKLPTSIRDLLHDAFRSTYANAEHPELLPGDGFYSKEQIDKTYQVFYDILKLMKKMYVEPPEDPFFGVGDILADALDAFRKPPSAPDSGSSSCSWEDILAFGFTSSSRDCYDKFFNEVVTWMEYMGELMLWTLETIRNLIDLLLSILLSIPIGVLLAILYGIQLLTYKCYITSRVILSQSGFITPEPSELDSSIARNLVTLFYPCARNFKNFPSVSAPMISHAVCPVETPENPSTAAGFYKGDITVTPDFFISVEPLRLKNLYSYSAASTPAQTRSVQDGGEGIGNAVDFAAWMITGANVPNIKENDKAALYNNWNLDADRGYGYKTWKGTVPGDSPWNVSNEEYI
jgi:hypothetical protein